VGAASGEMLYPIIVGNVSRNRNIHKSNALQLFNAYGPIAFTLMGNLTVILMAGAYFALTVAGMDTQKSTCKQYIQYLNELMNTSIRIPHRSLFCSNAEHPQTTLPMVVRVFQADRN
jgi:hypothetical protein